MLTVLSLYGDMVKNKTLACPTKEILKSSLKMDLNEALQVESFAIGNSCVVLTREDAVQAVGKDVRDTTKTFVKVYYKKKQVELYMFRKALTVEQPGTYNSYKF